MVSLEGGNPGWGLFWPGVHHQKVQREGLAWGCWRSFPRRSRPGRGPLHRLVWYLLESSVTAQWILYLTLPGLISSPVGMLGKTGRALHLLKEIRFYFVSYIGVYLRPSLKKGCCSHCRSQVGASGLGSGSVPRWYFFNSVPSLSDVSLKLKT